VAAIITQPDIHAGMRYRPTGPALLSGKDMAGVIAKVVGHGVLPVNMPLWLFRKVARMTKVPEHEVFNFRDYVSDHRAGTFEFEDGVTDVVKALTGVPAESFEATARRYAAMPFARQTLGNQLKAFVNFNLVPFYPAYNLGQYQREHQFSIPPNPSLSVEDATWRAEHALQIAGHRLPDAGGVLAAV
jgi:NAD(P)H dehydrogenase (quinone)